MSCSEMCFCSYLLQPICILYFGEHKEKAFYIVYFMYFGSEFGQCAKCQRDRKESRSSK